jgi:hypothetical protein
MWQKFATPSLAKWPAMDEAIDACRVDKTIGDPLRGGRIGCFNILDCVLEKASPNQAAQFSSAGTILGLVCTCSSFFDTKLTVRKLPTVLSIMSISVEDLLEIHCRFPILAFLLAMCNPSTISGTLVSTPTIIRPLHSVRSRGLKELLSYGLPLPFGIRIPCSLWFHDFVLHFIASGCVAMISYQVLVLGWKGVIVFACWTWHNPFTWVSVGAILHLMRVVSWRWCLGPINPEQPWNRWTVFIARSGSNLTVVRPRFARLLALFFQVTGLMNYGYGTVALSGMMLINPYYALRTFVFVALSSLLAKISALWLLAIYPDVPKAQNEGAGKEGGGGAESVEMREGLLKDRGLVTISATR